MILEFSAENFRSINEEITLSFLNGRTRSKSEHLSKVPKVLKSKGILPVGMIFGGNASGKTNLILALLKLKRLVIAGTSTVDEVLPYEPHLLCNNSEKATRFSLTFLAEDDNPYRYSISYTERKVETETLEILTPTSSHVLFSRKGDDIELKGLQAREEKSATPEFLDFVATGTRSEQPFITEARQRNVSGLKAVFSWFTQSLEYISPEHRPNALVGLTKGNLAFRDYLETQAKAADLGVDKLILAKTPLEEATGIPEYMKKDLRKSLKNGQSATFSTHGMGASSQRDFIMATKQEDAIHVITIKLGHRSQNGDIIAFDHQQESDGTRRLMELLVAFYELEQENSTRVFVIDELDRSLHPFITQLMLKRFLSRTGADRRAQLIFTTHDTSLLDQELFRLDEIICLEKSPETCATTLFSLDDLQLRSVKRIRAAYLNGSLGGVPRTAEIDAY